MIVSIPIKSNSSLEGWDEEALKSELKISASDNHRGETLINLSMTGHDLAIEVSYSDIKRAIKVFEE